MIIRTYTTKSNAARAAKREHGTLEGLDLCGEKGAFYYCRTRPEPKSAPAAPKAARKAAAAKRVPRYVDAH